MRAGVSILPLLLLLAAGIAAPAAEPPPELAPHFAPPPAFAGDLGTYRSPLKFYDGRPVRTAEEWKQRRVEIRTRWHELMGRWPPLLDPPRVETIETRQHDDLTRQRVRVEIAPGQFTEAWLLLPGGDGGPYPAVIVPFYGAGTGAGLDDRELLHFGYQLTKRGFVTLSLGGVSPRRQGASPEEAGIQPLSFMAYAAANCRRALADMAEVDGDRIGILGHSYGGKWAMFASCLHDGFACGVWSDGGIVFDEKRANVNYWEPWYLGFDPETKKREPGIPSGDNPRTGAYRRMIEGGFDLHELHALMAPRPFLVSGGSEDHPERWKALNHAVAVNDLLGARNRVAMTNRPHHTPTPESNEQIYRFLEHFLKR